VPAAAVIPAPLVYTNFAAVKTLVVRVGFESGHVFYSGDCLDPNPCSPVSIPALS